MKKTKSAKKGRGPAARRVEGPDHRVLADACFRITGAIIVALDRKGRVTYLNEKGYALLGYRRGSLSGRDWFATVLPSDQRIAVRKVFDLMMKGRLVQVEHYKNDVLTKKGEPRTVLWHNALLHDAKGRIAGALSAGADITDLGKAEAAIRQSEEYFRVTMNSIGDALISTTARGRVRFLNPVAEQLTGWRDAEARGRPVTEVFRIFNSRTRKPAVNPVARVLKTGRIVGLGNHTMLVARDGTERQIADSASPIRSPGGGLIGVVMVFRDVTRQYAINSEIRESRERFRTLFESIVGGVVVGEPESRSVFLVNSAFCQLTGFTKAELVGKPLLYYHPRKDWEFIRENFDSQLHARHAYAADIPVLKKDGSVWYADIHTSALTLSGRKFVMGIFQDVTARKEAERNLRENEEKFRSLIEASPMGVHMYNVDDRGRLVFTGANPAADRILKVDHSVFIGKEIGEAFPPLLQTEVPTRYLRAALDGESWQTEQISYRDERIQGAFLVRAYNTGPRSMAAMFLDNTESKKLEESLRANEERYRSLVENSPDMIARFDRTKKLIFANSKALNFLGKVPETAIGRAPESLGSHPDRASAMAGQMDRVISTGEMAVFELEAGPASGGRQISYLVVPEKDESGAVRSVLVVGHDVTEIRAMQDTLRQAEERLELAIDSTGQGTWDFDATTGNTFVSERWAEMLGYRLEELPGPGEILPWFQGRVHPDDAAGLGQALAEHMQGRSALLRHEFRVRTRDDRWIRIQTLGKSVSVSADGKPLRVVGMHTDVTEQRILEEKLRQSEKMDAVGQLAGGVAHDFNNQLTGIMGYADLLVEGLTDNPGLRQYAEFIVAAARRSSRLTGQLLAFARKGKFQSVAVNVHLAVAEAVSMLEHSLDKKIVIRQRLEAREQTILGDPGQVQNALLNLAINGRDAMPAGGTLTFETSNVSLDRDYCRGSGFKITEGRYIRVCVRDTGLGMDRETQSHLFEPFFTTKEKGRGTGLGLAAVYGIVKNHKGSLDVRSEPGKGSEFCVYLPVVPEPVPEDTAEGGAAPTIAGSRILIIDDEEDVCKTLSAMLKSLGCSVEECRGGGEAVDYFRSRHGEIDLVLLDMIMPGLNGPEIFAELKAIDPAVRVVISSGYSLNEEAQKLIDEGAAGFIQKPYQRAGLAETVSRVLRDKPGN